MGFFIVLIEGLFVVFMGSEIVYGGIVVLGVLNVMIGE